MRLLNVNTLEFKEFFGTDIPWYIIASHRWGDDEPTYGSFESHKQRNSAGYRKVDGFCYIARQTRGMVEWLWINTCCIDKTNSVELGEAINSMFKWYQKALVCYAYLHDLEPESSDLSCSAWFSRGWTLQELLAPSKVVFLRRDWSPLGYKTTVKSGLKDDKVLNTDIASITGIPVQALYDFNAGKQLSVNERLGWAASRQTTRPEDIYYSLLGIFGVYMTPIYGEGAVHAKRRLLKEINEADTMVNDVYSETQSEHDQRHKGGVVRCEYDELPRSIFIFQDKVFGMGSYTVIKRDGYYEKIRDDGKVLMRVAFDRQDPREAKLATEFLRAGEYELDRRQVLRVAW